MGQGLEDIPEFYVVKKKKKKKKPEDDSSFDATSHNSKYKRKFKPSKGCINFCKQKGCKIVLGFVLCAALFMTGLYTYQFWIQREDKLMSIEAFKQRLKFMEEET